VRRAVQAGGPTTQATFNYDDTNRVITTTSDLYSFNDNILVSKTLYDQLGRKEFLSKVGYGQNQAATL